MIKSVCLQEFEEESHRFTRNYEAVSIRQSNREERFNKRRKIVEQETQDQYILDPCFQDEIRELFRNSFEHEEVEELIEHMQDSDIVLKHRGIIGFRKIINKLSSTTNCQKTFPLFQKICKGEILDLITQFTQYTEFPQLVYESSWCLANFTSIGTQKWTQIEEDTVIEALVQIGKSNTNILILENMVLGIGNMSVEGSQYRDKLIEKGAVEVITSHFCTERNEMNQSRLASVCWALSNLCRGDPLPPYSKVKNAVLYLACFLPNISDTWQQLDSLSALSHQVILKNKNLDIAITSGASQKIIECLRESSSKERILILSMRILGNITAGEDELINSLIDEGLIDAIAESVKHESPSLQKETCWVLSNIIVNNQKVTEQVLANPNILPRLKQFLSSPSITLRKECLYFFTNLTSTFLVEAYYELLLKIDLVQHLIDLLKHEEWRIIYGALRCLNQILSYFNSEGDQWKYRFLRVFDQYKGVLVLEDLQYNGHRQIYSLTSSIIKKYLDIEGEIEITLPDPTEK